MKTPFLLFLALVPLLFSLGCGEKITLPSAPEAQPAALQPMDMRRLADQAWQSGDYPASQRLYARLADRPELPEDQKGLIWKRLTLSAIHNQDFVQGASALAAWTRAEPEARTSGEWNLAKGTLIKEQQGGAALETFLAATLVDTNLPWATKKATGTALIEHYRAQHNEIQALQVYRTLYAMGPDSEAQKNLEITLQAELQTMSIEDLAPAVDDTTLGTLTDFPKNILIPVYDLKRLAEDETLWGQVWQDLHILQDKGAWADSFPFAENLQVLTEQYGHPARHIALLIPLQGPYASVGWRIARGVGAAQGALSRQGMELDVTLINSADPHWMQEIAALPASCRIIGGPLQKKVWETALENDLYTQRVFFTFMPSMADEGEKAWRFFGSPRDQVRTVINAARAQDISRFAILYPQEPYGTKMAQYFWEEATQLGGEITAMSSYTPQKPTLWGKTIAAFLNAQDLEKGDLNPEPDFQAVFLPDSLDNAQLIAPQFFFYNENRLMFLGPQLWGQSTTRQRHLETRYFDLAVFPGAWWDENPNGGVTTLTTILEDNGQKEADFWVALGYDFTRFAARMVVPTRTISKETINAALSGHQPFEWAMAPLSWDQNGLASQHYFIFQPTPQSPKVAVPERITRIITSREARRKAQLEALNATLETNATEDMDTLLSPIPAGGNRPTTTPSTD